MNQITRESIKTKTLTREGIKSILQANGANALLIANTLDEILNEPNLPPPQRQKCFAVLRKICGTRCLLPDSHNISNGLVVDTSSPVAAGGYADVYKGIHKGVFVAVKVLRRGQMSEDDLIKLKKPFFREAIGWKRLSHRNLVPFLGASSAFFDTIALVSLWMDNGHINAFITRHPDVNRMELLTDVATGLEYLHSLEIVHGDLKGLNIFISLDRRALLGDFGLMTAATDSNASVAETSASSGGTTRWMAPELLSPEDFGLSCTELTMASDIYALGMVILEVLTGNLPFSECKMHYAVGAMVVSGKRPARPAGSHDLGISDQVWQLLTDCWSADRPSRPNVIKVRNFIQEAVPAWTPPPAPGVSEDDGDDESESDWTVADDTVKVPLGEGAQDSGSNDTDIVSATTSQVEEPASLNEANDEEKEIEDSSSPFEKPTFNDLNSSAPALFSSNPPTSEHRSVKVPAKRVAFAPNLSIYDTFHSSVYDRRQEPATWTRLTPVLAEQIKEELNSYKIEEMEVHASSRIYTHFFVLGGSYAHSAGNES